jgi:hypothetical protein
MLSLVNDLKDIPPDRKLRAKGEIISVIAKHKTFFPAPSANPYPFPNTNPYYPPNLAISQTAQQQQRTPSQLFLNLQLNHNHSSNSIPFHSNQLTYVGHPHYQIHQVLWI